MNIVVCYKLTPDAEDVEVRYDGTVALEQAEWNISDYDLMAIEAAVQLAESVGGAHVSALSVGASPLSNSKAKKDVLSRGTDDLYLVIDETLRDADTNLTARALAAALRKRGAYDLVLCGEGSADLYTQQVGIQLGELLRLPTWNAVSKISVTEGMAIVERRLENEVEVLEVPLPAVLSVTADMNTPRLPTMMQILKAGKKPVTEWALRDLPFEGTGESRNKIVSTRPRPQADRKRILLEGPPSEVVQQLLGHLSKDGVL